MESVVHQTVDSIKIVHEAECVHLVPQHVEVPANPGVDAVELGGVGIVEARDLPVGEVATKEETWHTVHLQVCGVVEVLLVEIMFLLLTAQPGRDPLPVLALQGGVRADGDELSRPGRGHAVLGGHAGQPAVQQSHCCSTVWQ